MQKKETKQEEAFKYPDKATEIVLGLGIQSCIT